MNLLICMLSIYGIKKAELCFFREPKQVELKENKPVKKEVLPLPEEELAPETSSEENNEEVRVEEPSNSEEEVDETSEEGEEETVSQEGILRRAIRWFWGLFGIGKEDEEELIE